jgi:hypothetical protein
VLAVWLSPPVLSNAFVVFPEVFALLATAWILRVSAGRALDSRTVCVVALVLGLLPWFHRKYAIYSLALGLVLAGTHAARMRALDRRTCLVALALFAIPVGALVLWTWYHWGNLGGALMTERTPFAWATFQAGALGLIIDRENGLLVWAPVYLFLASAWALTWRDTRLWLLPVAAVFLPAAAHDQWWGGFSPAARFLVPLAPIFALAISRAMSVAAFRTVFLLLLVPQVLISAYGWQHPRAMWPRGDGNNRVVNAFATSFGRRDTFIPSIRVERNLSGGATALGGILLVNAAFWLAVRRRTTDSAAATPSR